MKYKQLHPNSELAHERNRAKGIVTHAQRSLQTLRNASLTYEELIALSVCQAKLKSIIKNWSRKIPERSRIK